MQKFDLLTQTRNLITYNGTKNKRELTKLLAASAILWKKIIAQVDIVQINSMVEAVNGISGGDPLKYRYLFPKPVIDTEDLIKTLDLAVENFNNMPNGSLYGHTPNEVLKGAIPDKHFFKNKIQKAKQGRMETNQHIACDIICQT